MLLSRNSAILSEIDVVKLYLYQNVGIICHFFGEKSHKVSLCGNSLSPPVFMAVFIDGNIPIKCFEGILIFKEDAFCHLDI